MTWNPLRRPHLTAKLSFAPSVIDRAEDQQLEVLYYKLQHVEETSRRLQKNMKKYIEYLTNASKSEQRITSELSSSQICFQNDELRKIVEDYHSVTVKGNENVAELSSTSQQCFQEPLKKFISMFAAIDAAFQNREQLAQEWRNLSVKVRKLEEKERTGTNIVKLERERKALAAASTELLACHSSLLFELRYFLEKRPDFFHPILEAFMRSQLEYHGNMTRLFTMLVKISYPQSDASPSSAMVPENEFQASVNEKLHKLQSLSIVRQKQIK
ncbi:hypothetical protein R5R35_007316 [Gryllus longicercus]|uniref:BAR domain-containing protein n=1 Tax=Gryllus longicercus TaxID=2509291 RepID=A0AAN9Z4T2_9ORTH